MRSGTAVSLPRQICPEYDMFCRSGGNPDGGRGNESRSIPLAKPAKAPESEEVPAEDPKIAAKCLRADTDCGTTYFA
jgi:hypothetical protein